MSAYVQKNCGIGSDDVSKEKFGLKFMSRKSMFPRLSEKPCDRKLYKAKTHNKNLKKKRSRKKDEATFG